jgi:S1-C subfamily serine protease
MTLLRKVHPVVLLVVGIGLGALFAPAITSRAVATPLSISTVDQVLTDTEQIYSNVYSNLAPSVVSITVAAEDDNDRLFEFATGSGFVIDTNGHIVTNFHVVEGADRIEVQFFDGTITSAEIIGLDDDSDIAVIRVEDLPTNLRPVVFGDSNLSQVGQGVLALGNPFQNNWTLTSGIISAINRRITGLNNYSVGGVIQTDAAINPGNSGGPLLNLRGEVIGMNTQIFTTNRDDEGTAFNSGIGFAVPSNLIVKVAQTLIQTGEISYSYMGISQLPISLDLIEVFDLPNNIRGVAILETVNGGPAQLAGLQSITRNTVDIITAVNGVTVRDFDELVGWLAINTEPGQTVTITVYRDGQLFDTSLTLVERPN